VDGRSGEKGLRVGTAIACSFAIKAVT